MICRSSNRRPAGENYAPHWLNTALSFDEPHELGIDLIQKVGANLVERKENRANSSGGRRKEPDACI